MLVDDDDDTRVAWGQLVASFGVHVVTAANGEAALRLIEARRPDLILCDLQMPGLDGFGLVRRLRADPRFRQLLVFAVTGLDSLRNIQAIQEVGFDGHVVKPLTPQMITRFLDRVRLGKSPAM
jgi:CheY-like chemotaxis protein